MEFRIAVPTDQADVENLWAYCFEPKDNPFFQYYFTKAYESENTMVGLEAGKLLSMVHLRQYDLKIRGAVQKVSYMVGVATDPIARRGGVGKELLRTSLEELVIRKQGLTILMPSKAAFYQQYGWDLYAHQWVTTLPLEELRSLTDRTMAFHLLESSNDYAKLATVYEEYTKDLSGYAVRGEKEWRRLIDSLAAEGVRIVYVTGEEGHVEGYAMYRLGEPTIMVTEMVYTSRRAQKGLLNFIYNHRSQGDSIRWNEGLHDGGYAFWGNGKSGHETMPFMMARVVDVKLAMESIPVPKALEGSIHFGVRDDLCPWNHGTYTAVYKDGEVVVEKIKDHVDVNVELVFSVGGLALLLMGRMNATELHFEDKLVGPEAILELLDRAYPKEKCYINEWW